MKIVIKIGPKTFYVDLPKDADNNLIHEIGFIIKQNEFLAEHTIKTKLVYYCLNISLSTETISMNIENSKTSEPHKFVLNLSQILDLRSSNKHVAL